MNAQSHMSRRIRFRTLWMAALSPSTYGRFGGQAIRQIVVNIMFSHLAVPRHFRSIAFWISVLMFTGDAGYGQITQIVDQTGDRAGNALRIPYDIATDGSGNVFITGRLSDNAFKITPDGAITRIIGRTGDRAGNSLSHPIGIATDGSGNVFVTGAESSNVFKITPEGTVTQIMDRTGDRAGNNLNFPSRIATDRSGNVFVTDTDNVFKITPGGSVTRIIGPEGDGKRNPFRAPRGIATDCSGNVFVTGAGSDNAFKITPGGTITQIIDRTGDGSGNSLRHPYDIATDGSGNVFVSSGDGRYGAFKITPGGSTTQIIGPDGDGKGNSLRTPIGIATDASGNVFVAGVNSSNAFMITPEGRINRIIGPEGDGNGNSLINPFGIVTDASGNVFVTGGESNNAFRIPAGGGGGTILCSPPNGSKGLSPEVILKWLAAADSDRYNVQVFANPTLDQLLFSHNTPGLSVTFTDPNPGQTRYWRVQPTGPSGSFPFTAAWSFTTANVIGEGPTIISPQEGTDGVSPFATFIWRQIHGADTYQLQIDTDGRFLSPVLSDSSIADTTFTVTDPLRYGTTYFWRVRARNSAGFGPWSDELLFIVAVGTATENDRAGVPTSYALHANYPNPFNPTTTIQIDLPETAHVRLVVYDVLGHIVLRLEDGSVPAGRHRYLVDASTLPSGIYWYRLGAGAFSESRRMLLLK